MSALHALALALSLLGPAAAPAAAVVPAAVARAQTPTEDAIAAFDAARANLVALRDQLLREATERLRQAAEITKRLGETPGPGPKPPDPGPGPQPPTPLPARQAAIRDLALKTVPDYPGRPAMAQRLARELFADISSRISQAAALNPTPPELVPYRTVAGAQAAYVARFRELVGTERAQWAAFSTAFAAWVDAEQKAGRLTLSTPADLAAFFDDVAAGLASAFATQQRGG